LITIADLRSQTVKDLSSLARKMGLTGVHSMTKDQLVRALVKASKAKAAATARTLCEGKAAAKKNRVAVPVSTGAGVAVTHRAAPRGVEAANARPLVATPKATTDARVVRKIQRINEIREQHKDLSHATAAAATNGHKPKKPVRRPTPMPIPGRDRVVLLVRDPYWLQVCWDVTRQSVGRARAALAEHWHTCEPTLRLIQVDAGATTSTAETLVRDIPIHGGVKNWYIDIQDSPNSFRVDLGYRAENGRFYTLARSNVVTTPRPGSSDAIDENWTDIAENYEKIYA